MVGPAPAVGPPRKAFAYRFKLAVVGARGAGKSSLIRRIKWNLFNPEIDEFPRVEALLRRVDDVTISTELEEFDLSEIEESATTSENVPKVHVRKWVDVNAVLCVYSTTDRGSYQKLIDAVHILQKRVLSPDCDVCVVGTRCDEQKTRDVSYDDAEAFCEKKGISLFEVSAKTGVNCEVCVDEVLSRLLERQRERLEHLQEAFPQDEPYPREPLLLSDESVKPRAFCLSWFRR